MQVWAGTGEPNSRNTIEPGEGIYKSTDGGLTWKLMGLEKTQHIGRIVVHPTNPNIVYVAALGAAWKANPERGLYKTDDGGQTWKLVKFISDKAGFIDVALDPKNPERRLGVELGARPRSLLPEVRRAGVGALEDDRRRRDVDGDEGRRLPRDDEGPHQLLDLPAATPTSSTRWSRPTPIRGQKPAPGAQAPEARERSLSLEGRRQDVGEDERREHAAVLLLAGSRRIRRIRIASSSRRRRCSCRTTAARPRARRRRACTSTTTRCGSTRTIRITSIVGNDGGIAITWDSGGNYDFAATLPIAQFYSLSYDFEMPYNVCGGAQDNGSWCGPSRRKTGR